jgi:hypothetical protein
MKGGTLVSKIDFTHSAHIDAPDQVIVAELPFSMNMPVICQIMLFFLKNIDLSGSFPQWRREDPEADPWWVQGDPGPARGLVPQSATADQSDLVAGMQQLTINRCQYWSR